MQGAASGEEAANDLRWKLWWAVVKTNLIGMPVLLVLVFVVFGITVSGLLAGDFTLDPLFMPFNFLVLGTISASLVVLHYYIVIRSAEPCFRYLREKGRNGPEKDRELAQEALDGSNTFSFTTMTWSGAFYVIGVIICIFAINLGYCYSFRQIWAFFMGAVSTGMLVSVFQFYTSRKALRDLQTELLQAYPDLLLEESDAAKSIFEVGIRGRFLGAMIILSFVSVVIVSVAAFNTAHNALQRQVGINYMQDLDRWYGSTVKEMVDGKVVSRRVEAGQIDTNIETILNYGLNMQELKKPLSYPISGTRADFLDGDTSIREDEDLDKILVLKKDKTSWFGNELDHRYVQLAELIIDGGDLTPDFRRPAVHTLGDDIYTTVLGPDETYTVDYRAGDTCDVFLLIPSSRYGQSMRGMYIFVYGVMIVILLPLSLMFGKLASEEVRDPLVSIMETLRAMAQGDLSKNVNVTGRDEIGVVSRSLARAIFTLRRLIGKIGEAAAALDESATSISHMSGEVSSGSQTQAKQVGRASDVMEEMSSSVLSIAESIQTLASSTEESSASIIEVQATIEEVAMSVDSLSSSVGETSSSIQEMNSSIKEVADNVGHLTRKSEESMKALMDMEKAIDRVTASSRETAAITELVGDNATQGTHSVEMTIKGIDKIQATSNSVAEVITSLGARTQEIGNILNVINDVTDETGLLALNAAIIAAQAGEHGRGFSVVADEIKDLAERTAASTKEIAALIEAVQEDAGEAVRKVRADRDSISEGVRLAQDAGKALSKIEESVKNAMTQTRAIAEAAALQADKSKQVLEFMDGVNSLIFQVHQATQEQTRTGDQIAAAADRMEEIAQQVKRATHEQTQGSRQITQSIEHIVEITHYINGAQADQQKGTGNVREAVRSIKEVADSNSDRVDVMTKNVSRLNKLANELRDLMKEFTLD